MNRLLHFLEQGVFPVPCPPEIPDKFAASSCLSLLLATLDETCQALSKVLYSATATVSAHVCPCLPMSAHVRPWPTPPREGSMQAFGTSREQS